MQSYQKAVIILWHSDNLGYETSSRILSGLVYNVKEMTFSALLDKVNVFVHPAIGKFQLGLIVVGW